MKTVALRLPRLPLAPQLLLALLLLCVLAPLPARAADSNLLVAGAWIRQPTPGSDVAAVYLSLENVGTRAVKLIGAESPAAAMVMMHETVESGGQSRMRALNAVWLAPGASVAFTPGGRHLMLHGLTHPLQVGERVPLALEFAGGIKLHVVALVRPLGAG
ncbi:MAG TPA: copper chaperone PCu(A)C [Steroidobacteraceae bacterium]|nr:copper chaperone PCu(A)C [Steroidobacteraceae bacterium]